MKIIIMLHCVWYVKFVVIRKLPYSGAQWKHDPVIYSWVVYHMTDIALFSPSHTEFNPNQWWILNFDEVKHDLCYI